MRRVPVIWNAASRRAPRATLRALQRDRLRTAVAWAVERVAFHRSAFAAAGVDPGAIKSVDDLERLPFTRKADLRDHYPWGLFAVSQRELARVHASSGIEGQADGGRLHARRPRASGER